MLGQFCFGARNPLEDIFNTEAETLSRKIRRHMSVFGIGGDRSHKFDLLAFSDNDLSVACPDFIWGVAKGFIYDETRHPFF